MKSPTAPYRGSSPLRANMSRALTLATALLAIAAESHSQTPPLVVWTSQAHTQVVMSLAYSTDQLLLASAGQDARIGVWTAFDGQLLRTMTAHAVGSEGAECVDFSPNAYTLASSGRDNLIWLWDASTGTAIRSLANDQRVHSVDFSPDGSVLASGSGHAGAVKFWRVSDGALLQTLTGHSDGVISVDYSPDGNLIASGSADLGVWRINIYSTSDGALLRTLLGHTNHVEHVQFSPDGALLASGSADATVRLWDVDSGTLLRTLAGHAGVVVDVAFSPDGQTLGSSSVDGTVRFWRVSDGAHLLTIFDGSGVPLRALTVSPDGHYYAYGRYDGTIVVARHPFGNLAPVSDAGPDIEVCAAGSGGSQVALNGTASYDPENDPISYTWTGNFPEGGGTVEGAGPAVTLPIGVSMLTLTVNDGLASSQDTVAITVHRCLGTAGPATIWIGLKNSDDVGTSFDLRAEVYVNSALAGSGEAYEVWGGSSGFNNAHRREVPITVPQDVAVRSGDTVSFKLYVRVSAGSNHRNGTARLWFGDQQADSGMPLTIATESQSRYLLAGFALGASPGPGPKQKIDVSVNRNWSAPRIRRR